MNNRKLLRLQEAEYLIRRFHESVGFVPLFLHGAEDFYVTAWSKCQTEAPLCNGYISSVKYKRNIIYIDMSYRGASMNIKMGTCKVKARRNISGIERISKVIRNFMTVSSIMNK